MVTEGGPLRYEGSKDEVEQYKLWKCLKQYLESNSDAKAPAPLVARVRALVLKQNASDKTIVKGSFGTFAEVLKRVFNKRISIPKVAGENPQSRGLLVLLGVNSLSEVASVDESKLGSVEMEGVKKLRKKALEDLSKTVVATSNTTRVLNIEELVKFTRDFNETGTAPTLEEKQLKKLFTANAKAHGFASLFIKMSEEILNVSVGYYSRTVVRRMDKLRDVVPAITKRADNWAERLKRDPESMLVSIFSSLRKSLAKSSLYRKEEEQDEEQINELIDDITGSMIQEIDIYGTKPGVAHKLLWGQDEEKKPMKKETTATDSNQWTSNWNSNSGGGGKNRSGWKDYGNKPAGKGGKYQNSYDEPNPKRQKSSEWTESYKKFSEERYKAANAALDEAGKENYKQFIRCPKHEAGETCNSDCKFSHSEKNDKGESFFGCGKVGDRFVKTLEGFLAGKGWIPNQATESGKKVAFSEN